MRAITLLELLFWFIRFVSRIYYKLKGSEKLETRKNSKCKAKNVSTAVARKKKRSNKLIATRLQKKITPK